MCVVGVICVCVVPVRGTLSHGDHGNCVCQSFSLLLLNIDAQTFRNMKTQSGNFPHLSYKSYSHQLLLFSVDVSYGFDESVIIQFQWLVHCVSGQPLLKFG